MKPIAILALFILLLAGCNKFEEVDNGNLADLTFNISTSAIDSRNNVSQNPHDATTWNEAEKTIDGQLIYILSVFLIDEQKNIVSSVTDLTFTNQTTEATVSFKKLKRGNYTLMAVANYTDHKISNTTYQSGICSNWDTSDYTALMNNMIAITSDNISANNVIQPLSLMKNIALHHSNNYFADQLKRTITRLRIVVENTNRLLPLKIKKPEFNEQFTQTQAYVFDDGSDRKYSTFSKGAPVATSEFAICPFAPDTENAEYMSIGCDSSAVLFDGYMLETKLTNGQTLDYTLDLLYERGGSEEPEEPEEPNRQNWVEILSSDNITEGEYLIKHFVSTRYLTGDNGVVITTDPATIDLTNVEDKHIWIFESTGNSNSYYIKNKATGQYMQEPVYNQSTTLGSSTNSFTMGTYDGCVSIQGTTRYVYSSQVFSYVTYTYDWLVHGYTYYNTNIKFALYKNTPETKSAYSLGSRASNAGGSYIIPLTTIDPNTKQATTTTEIKRNDFIDVHITVSYNTVSGKIEYSVNNWKSAGGSVDFN